VRLQHTAAPYAVSSRRRPGPITTVLNRLSKLELQHSQNFALWLWVPDLRSLRSLVRDGS